MEIELPIEIIDIILRNSIEMKSIRLINKEFRDICDRYLTWIYDKNLMKIDLQRVYSLKIDGKLCQDVDLSPFPNLRRLKVRNFTLTSQLLNLPNLISLDCSHCNNIENGAFDSLFNLTTLDCSECQNIENGAFDSLVNLTTLDCSNCQNIKTGAFNKLTNLKILNCSNCQGIGNEAFDSLINLTSLYCLYCLNLKKTTLNSLISLIFINCDGCINIW